MASIPVIDFTGYGLGINDPHSVNDVILEGLTAETMSALSSHGFFYLRNHGINKSTIDDVYSSTARFFQLPRETKEKCLFAMDEHHGWVPVGSENADPEKPVDIYERLCFHMRPNQDLKNWPLEEIISLQNDLEIFFEKSHRLSLRVLSVIALGLGKERDVFEKMHMNIGKDGNRTAISSLYYPPIVDDFDTQPDQLRIGEHSDYGSITLLFQDEIGGLEVEKKVEAGTYIPLKPIPGTVIVIIGDALQRWTADRLLANKHRVVIPSSPVLRQKARRSIQFFVMADEDVMLTCMDGSDKYPPITMEEHLNNSFEGTVKDSTN